MLVQGSGLHTTFPGMASQFASSHSAMLQLQENMVQEQNLFISLLGSVWRRVSLVALHVIYTGHVKCQRHIKVDSRA